MHDNDFLKWRRFDWTGPRKHPQSNNAPDSPFTRISNARQAQKATFEDQLTFEDKLFLESIGISTTR